MQMTKQRPKLNRMSMRKLGNSITPNLCVSVKNKSTFLLTIHACMPRPRGIRKRRRRFSRSRRRRKRTFSRKSRRRRRTTLPLGGFPLKKLVRFRYVAEITFDATATNPGVQVFRANSLFDPDFTNIGHQPGNFDRWSPLYDHYTVIGSKISIQPVLDDASGVIPGLLVMALTAGETKDSLSTAFSLGGLQLVLEQPRLVKQQRQTGNRAPYNNLRMGFSAKRFFGLKSVVGQSRYQASMDSNPTDPAHFEIMMMPLNGNDPDPATFIATIDYLAVLTEPSLIEAS